MLNSVLGAFSADMALDLGSASARIAVAGRGVVCSEPTLLAWHQDRYGQRSVLAMGHEARAMSGRTPPDIHLARPVQDGVISDFEELESLMRLLMLEAQGRRPWIGPRVAVCVPHGTTEIERRALRECLEASGAREVHQVEGALAAAAGAELPIDEAHGQMLVDVGAGSTEVAVLSLGGIVYSRTLRLGGDQMDRAVAHLVRERLGLMIGVGMARELREALGSAIPRERRIEADVAGRRVDTGYPGSATVDSDLVQSALAEPVRLICEAVLATLEHTPPDLAADVAGTGIVLVGGCAAIDGLDVAIGDATGMPVVLAEDPAHVAVRGALSLLPGLLSRRQAG